jgi:hypothetical protein
MCGGYTGEHDLSEFEYKLVNLYKTAYSPDFGNYVGIKNVFFNEDWHEWCIQATVAGKGSKLYTFIPSDLQDYCL